MISGKKRLFIRIGYSAVAIALLALAVLVWRRQSAKEARQVDQWLFAVSNASDQQQDVQKVVEMGPRAIPIIFRRVRDQNPWRERIYRQLWDRIPTRIQTKLPKPKPWDYEDRLKRQAGMALYRFGPEGLSYFLKAAHDWNSDVRELAVGNLERFAVHSERTFNQLLQSLEDANAMVRIGAVAGLRSSSNRLAIVVPALVKRFNDSDKGDKPTHIVYVRANAARTVGLFGPAASNAIPALRKLKDSPPADAATTYATVQAACALWRIEQKPANVVPFMSQVLRSSSNFDDWTPILNALAEIGPPAIDAAPAIEAALETYRKSRQNGRSFHVPIDSLAEKALLSIKGGAQTNDFAQP